MKKMLNVQLSSNHTNLSLLDEYLEEIKRYTLIQSGMSLLFYRYFLGTMKTSHFIFFSVLQACTAGSLNALNVVMQ
jgi:hypothetical protein